MSSEGEGGSFSDSVDEEEIDYEEDEDSEEASNEGEDDDVEEQVDNEKSADPGFRVLAEASSTCVENVGAVVTQLKLWDQLMAARIKMQQVMKHANMLSLAPFDASSASKDLRKNAALSYKRASKIETHLQSVIDALLNSLDAKQQSDDDDDDDEESKPKENESKHFEIVSKEAALWEPILEQWWTKTSQPTPDKTSKAKMNFNQLEESPVKYAKRLLSDKAALCRRTQLKRMDYRLSNNDSKLTSEDYDARVFDDNDFYQTLVRDVIARKLASSNDASTMARAMMSGEKLTSDILRPKKQAVDRRASKGRKIRYNVMPKLVNYMGPDPTRVNWTDTQRDELFKSLFQPA